MKIEKSQAAFEYLITYGWAILGILIVGVVLWQFGAFSPPAPVPGCSGFSEIKPIDWKADKTLENFIIVLTNEAGLKLNITDIFLYIADANCGFDATDRQIRPGESVRSTINCNQLSEQYASGEYYRAHINITYVNPQSLIEHRSKGECWGAVE